MHISEYVCPRHPSWWRLEIIAALLACAASLTACETLSPTAYHRQSSSGSTAATFRPQAEYLTYMHMLAVALPATQKALYQQTARMFREQATPHDKLRFALALCLLDAPYGDIAKARRLFKELQSPAQTLPPEIESLVQVQLGETKHRLVLEERMALLQQSLDKAEAKIQALTTIEKTLEQSVPETKTKTQP